MCCCCFLFPHGAGIPIGFCMVLAETLEMRMLAVGERTTDAAVVEGGIIVVAVIVAVVVDVDASDDDEGAFA